ncbi:hypothetical protein M9H77_34882 [Catharanthus roseus]|uniref:Uncharacterized protein n=1 Tax=Catharanthus roseus TaxID=4058 RepID=A0ACB9ZMF1_CATRO|nr:hypothetical protein M9H77_34882 [Catharanthus roseus]
MESMFMVEATMDMENSFLEDMMDIDTSLLNDIMELVTSLFMLNLMGILLIMIIGVMIRFNAKYDYCEHSPYDCYEGYHHSYGREVYFESLYDENFYGRKNKNNKLLYSYFLSIDHFLKETKLNSFALVLDRISLEHPCTLSSMHESNHTMELEDQEESLGKELILRYENSSMSPFLNPSLLSHKMYVLFLLGAVLFLVVPCASKCLFYHASLVHSLLINSGAKFHPSCNDFRLLNDASFVDPNIVGFELECTLVYILHNKCIEKFVENGDYLFSFLDTFMENHNGF